MIKCASCKKYASVAQSVEQLIRNQQVVCSSHITSSRNALWTLTAGRFCSLTLDAAAGARYNKVSIEPLGTVFLFLYKLDTSNCDVGGAAQWPQQNKKKF